MNGRRFEHPAKHRFWEIYWDVLGEIETVSGAIGTKGRASRKIAGRGGVQVTVDAEIAAKRAQGFLEVRPETADGPQAAIDPAWWRRIAEAFDDDAPRLVLADWLQQQGDPLGEFIMLQCERARLERWDPKQKPMREREEHLISLYRGRWLPNLAGANVEFERGFVERLRTSVPLDEALVGRVFDAAPLLRTLDLRETGSAFGLQVRAGLGRLASPPLTGLAVRSVRLTPEDLEQLFEAPELEHVDRLELGNCALGGGDLRILTTRSFRRLDLHANAVGARGTHHVVRSASTLVELELGNAGIGDPGVIAIAEATWPQLQRLGIGRTELTGRSLRPLLHAPGLAALRALELAGNPLDAVAIHELAQATLPSLVELDLSACAIDDEAAIALARSPLVRRLAWLDLGHNAIGPQGAQALIAAELPALRFLEVSGNRLGPDAQRLKAAHPHARVVAREK